MFIVVEGFPGGGGAQLAQALGTALQLPVLSSFSPFISDAGHWAQGFTQMLEDLRRGRQSAIVDGGHLANVVFASRFERDCLSPEHWSLIDGYLARQRSWLLLLVDSPFQLAEHLGSGWCREEIGNYLRQLDAWLHQSLIPTKGSYRLEQFLDRATGERTAQFGLLVERGKEQLDLEQQQSQP